MSHPQLHWNVSLPVLLPIFLFASVYIWRFRQARREAGGRGAGWPQAVAFAGCILVLLIAVVSPIDRLGEDYLFSAHMVQHILLGDLAPLLFLLSLSRVIMRPATRRLHAIERKLGRFAHPAAFIAAWLALIYVWHIPAMYDAALEHPTLHGLEHATFFTAGMLLWWPLIQPVPMRHRLEGLQGLLYVFAAKASLGVLGLYLTWSTSVAFDYYNQVPRIWGLTAIGDQNVGGAIMMVEQALVLMLVFCLLFVKMLTQSEEAERRRERLEDAADRREPLEDAASPV
jgi:cytochrome c oxidase assembly factor CtaG